MVFIDICGFDRQDKLGCRELQLVSEPLTRDGG